MRTPKLFCPGFHCTSLDKLSPRLSTPRDFESPPWLDNRPYFLAADDQGNTSMCAAYAIAGVIEAHDWRLSNIQTPIDASSIYREAKARYDRSPGEGTTFDAVFEAAKSLNLISYKATLAWIPPAGDLRFAIHKYGAVLAGFDITTNWYDPSADGWITLGGRTLGGHAVPICWYDAEGVGFQNSWSDEWGVHGFGRLPWKVASKQLLQACAIQWPDE